MLSYTELSKAQKSLIDEIRQGKELRFNFHTNDKYFIVDAKGFTTKVNFTTAHTLLSKRFILECDRDEDCIIYCLNAEVTGIPYPKSHQVWNKKET
jgi:hypothetical protein